MKAMSDTKLYKKIQTDSYIYINLHFPFQLKLQFQVTHWVHRGLGGLAATSQDSVPRG
jgi:hypothetical protein